MTSPMQSKQGSGSRNLVRLCSHGWRVKKPSLIDRVFPAPKRDASKLPRHRNGWLPSCRVGDERSTARVPSKMLAAALLLLHHPKRSCQPRTIVAHTPRIIALDTLSVREGSGCFDHSSLSHPLQSCSISHLPDKPRQSSTDLAADWRLGHSHIVQPRSSGHVPSGTAATAMHIVSRPPSTGPSPR